MSYSDDFWGSAKPNRGSCIWLYHFDCELVNNGNIKKYKEINYYAGVNNKVGQALQLSVIHSMVSLLSVPVNSYSSILKITLEI